MDPSDVNTKTSANYALVRQNSANKHVSSSNTVASELHAAVTGNCVSNTKDRSGEIVERVHNMSLVIKDANECASSSVGVSVLPTRTLATSKDGMFEEEEGELDYEEDEGDPVVGDEGNTVGKIEPGHQDQQKEEGELEEGELGEEGEEGEILSDEDFKTEEQKKVDKKEAKVKETDGLEEGEVIEDGDSAGLLPTKRKICRYYTYGSCTWGMACRFLHPGLNDKGAYQMLPVPGQYPSPFPKVSAPVPVIPPDLGPQTQMTPPFADQEDDEAADGLAPGPEVIAPPKKESAWERGLKLAKEIKKAAQKRKEEDADFEEKRMILGITAEEDDDEHDKENLARRCDARSRLEKDPTHRDGDDIGARRPEDIVSRWRDKRDLSPYQYRDQERRKRRVNRSPSSSPERERRSSRRRGGEKGKSKEKVKEKAKEREKVRSKKTLSEDEKKREEKTKKQKDKEKPLAAEGEKKEEESKEVKEKEEKASVVLEEQEEKKNKLNKIKEETREKKPEEVNMHEKPQSEGKEISKDSYGDAGDEEKDKPKPKTLGISSSRLPNDEWMDPWQRTTSPKRHSTSSHSSRSRSSSSSSESSRSSRSRSPSGSESRSTSRSDSHSASRSISQTPSRSPSRSRSASRSKSRSRSGSRSSASGRSSSSSSSSQTKAAVVAAAPEQVFEEGAAKEASESESESESEESGSASPQSPPPVQKSVVKPKVSPDLATRTQHHQPPPSNQRTREKRNRYDHGQADRTEKWREGQLRQGRPWDRKAFGVRQEGQFYRGRDYFYRKGRSPERSRRRSRSPREREADRRRRNEGRARRRSSSADSMEHALARPSSPRPTRDRGNARAGSSGSSSDSESGSSEESDSDSRSEGEGNPVRMRRPAPPGAVKRAQNVPLTSGNIRYAGHKDIKLTLNKSASKAESNKPPSKSHSPPSRSEPSSSSDKQSLIKKRPRDPSPVHNAPNHPKDVVSSSDSLQPVGKAQRRSADSQAEPITSGKSNPGSTSSRREELLRELKAVEDAIARKRARIE